MLSPQPIPAASRQTAMRYGHDTDETAGLDQRLARASLRRVEAKEFVFAEGDPATHLYQVETGAVALYKVLCDGRRQVLGFAYPGDYIGLGSQGEYVINAQAMKPTRLRCLPLSALSQIALQDPRLGFRLYEALASELAATRELLLTTGQRSACERLVAFLLAISRRNASKGQDPLLFDLPMTRTDIADFLGLTIETVSRTFTKLRMLGLIELPHASHVRLLDIERLKGMEGNEAEAA
jgi:CRP/FNR family transcriptional regulator